MVLARWSDGLWYPAKIDKISQEDNKDYYNVHFPGWGKRYDDVFSEEQRRPLWSRLRRAAVEPEELKPFAMELRFPKALGQILVDDHDLVDRRGQLPTTSLLYKTERSHYDALHLKDPLDPRIQCLPGRTSVQIGEIERIARSHQGFLDWLETKEGDYFDRSAYFVPLDENVKRIKTEPEEY
ncbi:unnamed protein product, partial [Mesorhabditis spiculigera]